MNATVFLRSTVLGLLTAVSLTTVQAQPTVRINAANTHQKVTGFGGFVCSPQFGYGHMSNDDIKKVWGASSTVGCNIMRLYIPIGKNAWGQSLQTAKTAKQLGLIVFASPWGQPKEWKTNNSINGKEGNQEGKLKKENWPDYAQYLEDYVQYLRKNGVELDAISIQNEPDWAATYAGCIWSTSEMAEFVKTYGPQISCKVMAPESIGVSDGYVNALNKTDVLAGFDIYGGHQYGGIGSAYKQLAKKGKEVWMTEYLINWNENQASNRNFDFSKDFFNFFRAINVCMTGDFNAWIHYAAKRFYGMLGDGQMGTSNGTVTKRGYVMAHFAKFVTGMTRIDIDFGQTGLEGSAYLSQTGDTVVAVMANATNQNVTMTLDLPFYTEGGKQYSTTKSNSMKATALTLDQESCRPQVVVQPQCVSTVLYVRSRDRQPSDMKGTTTRFDRIDDMATTNSSFGTGYKLSDKTKKFDHSNPLISSRTDASSGYVALDDRYARLVIEIKKVSSTMNYSSAKTTLTYINAAGKVSSHDYGDLDLGSRENIKLVFDLSPNTLADGCKGLLSLTNNNWSSTLTLNLGNVTLGNADPAAYAATLSGAYVADDSYVQEYGGDVHCVSLDLTQVTGLPASLAWVSGKNRIIYLAEDAPVDGSNLVKGKACESLELATGSVFGFRPLRPFTAKAITLETDMGWGARLIMLPFASSVPDGVKAYTVNENLELSPITAIPAHTPVLVEGSGTVVFSGEGEVTFSKSPVDQMLRGVYTSTLLSSNDYILVRENGKLGFRRVEAEPATITAFDVYARLNTEERFVPLQHVGAGIVTATADDETDITTFDLLGRRMTATPPKPGLYIRNGKKHIK